MGRFNLCSAWEIGRLIDGWPAPGLRQPFRPPIANLPAFSAWARHVEAGALLAQPDALGVILRVAQRDMREVGPAWLTPWLRWCPCCVHRGRHLIAHQHKAARLCPDHKRPLLTQCTYCGATSPYKVKRDTSLFRCAHCGIDVTDMPATQSSSTHIELARCASDEIALIPSKAQVVRIPGFQVAEHAVPRVPQLVISDLQILFAERMLKPQQRSAACNILACYFQFHDLPVDPAATAIDQGVYQRALLQLMQEMHTIAAISGHSCVGNMSQPIESEYGDCPCGTGVRLWLRGAHFDNYRAFTKSFGVVPPQMYEASHLAVCLSLAWYASAQAGYAHDQNLYRSLLEPLEHQSTAFARSAGAVVSSDKYEIALLSHRFQWFAVHCKHSENRIRYRRQALHSARFSTDCIFQDVSWLTA